MSCDVIVRADNGKESKLYKDLLNITNDAELAHRMYLQTKSSNFKNWFNGSNAIDSNGEPIVKIREDSIFYTNSNNEVKSAYNFGTFGKQNTEQDVLKYFQDRNIVNTRKHNGKYWVKKGLPEDSPNSTITLLDSNLSKIDTFNEYYLKEFGANLLHTYKRGASYVVEVNNDLLDRINNRNTDNIYYSKVAEDIGDMNSNVLPIQSATLRNFTVAEEQYAINLATTVAVKRASSLSKLKIKDALNNETVRIKIAAYIGKASIESRKANRISDAQHATNIKIADEISKEDSLLWVKIRSEINLNSGYKITEVEDLKDTDDSIGNTFDDNDQFKVKPDDRVSNDIKQLINSIPKLNFNDYSIDDNGNRVYNVDRSTPGGLATHVRYTDVSGYIIQNISNANSVKDMMRILKDMANKVDPSFIQLVSKLEANTNLRNLFFSSFKSESPKRESNVINEDDENPYSYNFVNRSSFTRFQIADNWLNTLKSYKQSNFYVNSGNIDLIKNKFAILKKVGKDTPSAKAKINTLVSYFDLVGLDIPYNTVAKIVATELNNLTEDDYNDIPNKVNPEDYLTSTIINRKFGLLINDIQEYITEPDPKKLKDVLIAGNMLNLATELSFYYSPTTNAYINISGNQEQTFNKPTFIGDWFNMMTDDARFLEHLKDMVRDSKLRFSNWLITTNERQGFLKLPKDIKLSEINNNIDKLQLNKDFYLDSKGRPKFNYGFLEGIFNASSNNSARYSDITPNDWNFSNVINYFNNSNFARFTIISPADRGNSRTILAPRFKTRLSDFENIKGTRLKTTSRLFKAVYNIYKGELNRISNEYAIVFDENGKVKADIKDLYVGYHYIIDKDTNKPKFRNSDGSPTGSAFKFHNFDYVDDAGVTQTLDSLFEETPSIANEANYRSVVNDHILNMIKHMTIEQMNANKNNASKLKPYIKKSSGLGYTKGMMEYTVNRYIANAEMINFFLGDVAFYGNPDSANKRATELLASGVVNSDYGTNNTFNGVTINNRIINNEKFRNDIRKALKKQDVNPDVIDFVVNSYANIDSGDAQSYITWSEFKVRLNKFGLYNKYENLIDRIENDSSPINIEELNEFTNALKNFYYSYEFDGKRFVPNQVKNSEQVLIPRFIKGTELEALHDAMVANEIAQVNFASAEKVGSTYIARVSNEDGSLDISNIDSEFKLGRKKYYYKDLRKQQDILNHIVDEKNKLGVQIAKKIIDNVSDNKVIEELFQLYTANIAESHGELMEELGVISNENGEYTVNKEKLSKILINSAIERGTINNILQGFEIDESGEFKLPLDHPTTRVKNEAMINSLFTNRIINQKFPGIHGPQMSNAFMRQFKTGEDGKPMVSKSDDLKFTSFVDKNGKQVYQKAQIKIPAWSASFFSKGSQVSLEELKKAGLDTMVGYRIPTEDKHSMVVFEVVEILDSSAGSNIVVPTEFVPQTGSDFDIDSIYLMTYSFYSDRNGNLHKHTYYDDVETAYQERYGKAVELFEYLDSVIEREDVRDDATNNLLSHMLNITPEQFEEDTIDELLREKGYSKEIYDTLKSKIKNYPSKEEFIKETNPAKFNTRNARNNKILDNYIGILSDPANYLEMVSPNTLEDTNNSREHAEGIHSIYSNSPNFASPTTQDMYRARALAGRKLKGISVNRDSFISIAQRIGLRIKGGVKYQFDTNIYPVEKLEEYYGKGNVTPDGIVTLKAFGKNISKSGIDDFTNIEGKLITSYAAQSTAHILDNVKFPLPYNVNENTFNVWRLLPEIGGTWKSSTLLINQEAITIMSDYMADSIIEPSRGNPYNKTVNDLVRRAIVNNLDNYESILGKSLTNKLRKNKDARISREAFSKVKSNILSKVNTIQSDSKLEDDLRKYGTNSVPYITSQIGILEYYRTLENITRQISDFQLVTSYDKSRVGPSFSEIIDKEEMLSRVSNKSENEYINLLETENGGSYVEAVFGANSKYLPIQAYRYYGARTSYGLFSREFITEAPKFRAFIQALPKDNRKDGIIYTIAKNLSDLKFFDDTDVNRLLGTNRLIENIDISEVNNDNIEKFRNLSVANKLSLIKQQYKQYIDKDNILYYLNPIFDNEFYERRGIQGISFIHDEHTDSMVDSFRNMWYNKNPYYHLLARDLLKYSYFVNGLSFGRNLSKVIPTDILYNEPVVAETINGVDILKGIGYTSHLDKKRLEHFADNSINDYGILHRIMFARANTNKGNIVPNVNVKVDIGYMGEPRGANGRSMWNPDKDGIITIQPKQFYAENINTRRADVIRLIPDRSYMETLGVPRSAMKAKLYAKVPVRYSQDGENYDTIYYYVPVNKLEAFEFESTSRNPINNKNRDISHYLQIIARKHDGDIISEDFSHAFEDSKRLDGIVSFDDIVSEDPDKVPASNIDISAFTNHSGGAIGSDSQWDIIGSEYGMINNRHYYYGRKTPRGNTKLTEEEINEGIEKVKETYKVLNRPEVPKYYNLHGRNWFQVKNSDAVFAIGEILKPKEKGQKYISKANKETVDGGTGYAIEMAIQNDKKVYVYNQKQFGSSLDRGWYEWKEYTDLFGNKDGGMFVKIDTPTLTPNFAGIGTREITDDGKQAIRDVYDKATKGQRSLFSDNAGPTIDTSASWSNLKNQPVYTEQGVNTMRTSNKKAYYAHFGNPFSEGGYSGTLKVSSVEAATRMYKEWLLHNSVSESNFVSATVSDLAKYDKQREWILEQIDSGKLDNATLLYDKKLYARGRGSHAESLAEVIKSRRGQMFSVVGETFTEPNEENDKFIDYNTNLIRHAQAITSDYSLRLRTFGNYKLLEDIVSNLKNLNYKDDLNAALKSALRLDSEYSYRTIAALEKRMYDPEGYLNKDILKAIALDPSKRDNFVRFMNYANTFLKGLDRISNLQKIKKDNLTEDEKEINKAISRLLELSGKVNELKATHNQIMKTFFEIQLTPISTNPEIKLGIRKLFDVQDDESIIMSWLDPLADTNHSFVANAVKQFIIDRGIADEEAKKMIRDYDNRMRDLLSKHSFDEIMEADNKLIQEFDDQYKEDWENFYNELNEIEEAHGKYSKQYYTKEKEFKKWLLDNINSEESKEIELAKFKANDILNSNIEARKQLESLKQARNNILTNYSGIMDHSNMSDSERTRLGKINEQIDSLKNTYDRNGNKKTGEALAIAETIQEYDKAYAEIFDKYYDEVIVNKQWFEENLKKYKNLDTDRARKWIAANTRRKVDKQFWEDFKEHATILGKEGNKNEFLESLRPFRDKDGIVNGNAVSDELRSKVKQNNESRVEDVEGRNPKAITKPKNDEHYDESYYAWYDESSKGYDSRDDDPTIQEYKNRISQILISYINKDGLLDTTSISLQHLDELNELENKIAEAGINYKVNDVRRMFNEWFNETHENILNREDFTKAEKIALSKGKNYHSKWKKLNTELRYDNAYFDRLAEIKKRFRIKSSISQNPNLIYDTTSLNYDKIRELYKVESISELPAEVRKVMRDKQFSLYDSENPPFTLSEYLRSHKVKKGDKTVNRKFSNIKDAAKWINVQYNRRLNSKKGKKYILYRDAVEDMHSEVYTEEYHALLKKHGEGSKWYNDNHVIDYQGNIVPAPYWVIRRPKDKTLYEENAPARKYWSYNIVKDKTYVDKKKSASKKWTNDNTNYTTTRYYEETYNKNKAEMSEANFAKWYEDNHFFNPYTNKYEPISIWTTMLASDRYTEQYSPAKHLVERKPKKEYINENYRHINNKPLPTKDSKYYNPKYEQAKKNPLYQYINKIMNDLTAHYDRNTIADENQLPIIPKSTKKDDQSLAQGLLKRLGWYSYPSKAVTGENNDAVRILKMPYMSDLVKEELIEIPKEKEFSSREEYLNRLNAVIKENKEIKARNKEYTRANMNRDWNQVIRMFIQASNRHKFMQNREHEMKLILEQIKNLDLAKRRNIVERLRNITRINLSKDMPELYDDDTGIATEKGVNSNLEKHFTNFMNMIFYEEFEKDEGTITKIARVLQNASSAKGMWLNTTGAFNNVAYGATQIALETFSNYHFGPKDRLKAQKMYTSSLFHMLAEGNSEKSSSFTNAILKKFDIIEFQDEKSITNNPQLDRSIRKHLISTSSMYFMHHAGEHYMQNVALLAMMNSHKLVNGKVQSFNEYTFDLQYKALQNSLNTEQKHDLDKFIRDNKYKDVYLDGKADLIRDFILNSNSEVQNSFLEHLKELKENAKEEFEQYDNLIDAYELKDGVLSIKDGYEISDVEFQLFKRKVISVNQKIHGIYNKLDAGTIQQYAVGRLAVQFKKWLRPGFIKRFGTRVGKAHWNESRNELDRGMYISTFNFFTKPISDAIRGVKGESNMPAKAIAAIFNNYGKFITNTGLYWHTLTESDRANVKRTAVEMLSFTMVAVLMKALQALADGDEDDKKWAYALYATDRLKTEILTYSPFYGFFNETRKLMRDPFAAMSFLEDVGKLSYTALFDRDAEYQGGTYHGEKKIKVQLYKNIPLANRWLRYQNIENYAGYYKLY